MQERVGRRVWVTCISRDGGFISEPRKSRFVTLKEAIGHEQVFLQGDFWGACDGGVKLPLTVSKQLCIPRSFR